MRRDAGWTAAQLPELTVRQRGEPHGVAAVRGLVRYYGGEAAEPDGVAVLHALAALGDEGIAAAIRETRERANLSQEQLAMLVGVSQPAISFMECGRVEPKLTSLCRIGAVLDERSEFQTPGPGPPRPRGPGG